MKAKPITEFYEKWKWHDQDKLAYFSELVQRLRDAGYCEVETSFGPGDWGDLYPWLDEHIGREHYVRVINIFWFENEHDASLFILRWK